MLQVKTVLIFFWKEVQQDLLRSKQLWKENKEGAVPYYIK